MIVAAFALGSLATVILGGCQPPTAVPRVSESSSNTTTDDESSINVTVAAETPIGDTPLPADSSFDFVASRFVVGRNDG